MHRVVQRCTSGPLLVNIRLHHTTQILASASSFYNKQSFYYDDVELFAREKKLRDNRNADDHWTGREKLHVVSEEYWGNATGRRRQPKTANRAVMKSTKHLTNMHRGMSWKCKSPGPLVNFTQRRSMANNAGEKKLSQKERLKKHLQEHGTTGVVLYGALWAVSMSACYVAVQSGIDVAVVLSKCGFSEDVVHSKIATGATTFAIAYGAHTLIAPVRIGLTIAGTPFLVRFRRKGTEKM